MSRRYNTLLDLMRRPEGCTSEEACAAIRVSPSTFRGMVRDLREVVRVETTATLQDKRRRIFRCLQVQPT